MNKKHLILCGTLALAFASGVSAEPNNWTGFKLGLGGGGAYTTAKQKVVNDFSYSQDYGWGYEEFVGGAFTTNSLGKANGFGTIDFALDYQAGDKFVFGLIGNYDIAKKRKMNGETWGSSENWAESCCGPHEELSGSAGVDSTFETGDSAGLGLRFGALITDSSLAYVTAGYSSIKFKQSIKGFGEAYSYNSDVNLRHEMSANNSGHKSGYFLGAGLETKFTDHASVKLEYRMSDYGKFKLHANNPSLTNEYDGGPYNTFYGESINLDYATLSQSTDLRVHQIRAVLSYDF